MVNELQFVWFRETGIVVNLAEVSYFEILPKGSSAIPDKWVIAALFSTNHKRTLGEFPSRGAATYALAEYLKGDQDTE